MKCLASEVDRLVAALAAALAAAAAALYAKPRVTARVVQSPQVLVSQDVSTSG